MTLSEGIWALSPRLCQADHLRKGEIVTDTKSFAGSSSAPPEAHLPEMSKKRRLAEAVAVTGGVFALFWLAPGGRGGVCLVAGVYLLAERRIRRRPWGEFGFDIRGSSSAMKRTWWLVGLVGVVLPVTYTVSAHVWWPELLDHDLGRSVLGEGLVESVPLLAVAALGEEMASASCSRGAWPGSCPPGWRSWSQHSLSPFSIWPRVRPRSSRLTSQLWHWRYRLWCDLRPGWQPLCEVAGTSPDESRPTADRLCVV